MWMLFTISLFLNHENRSKLIIIVTFKDVQMALIPSSHRSWIKTQMSLVSLETKRSICKAHLTPANEVLETLVHILLMHSLNKFVFSSSSNYCNNSNSHKNFSALALPSYFHCHTFFALPLGRIQRLNKISSTTGGIKPERVTIWRSICFGTFSACDKNTGMQFQGKGLTHH